MYHNFTFDELEGTKHFFRWNPTNVDHNYKPRELIQTLDGPPLVRVLDGTEQVHAMIWENVPAHKAFQYDKIRGLVGKTGYLEYNEMPELVGRKNRFRLSYFDHLNADPCWAYGCMTNKDGSSFDGTTLAPDGISIVKKYSSINGASNSPCIVSTGQTDTTMSNYNVFSVYVKHFNATKIALNIHFPGVVQSNLSVYTWGGADGTVPVFNYTSSLQGNGITHGERAIGDGWYRLWIGLALTDTSYTIGQYYRCYVYPNYQGSTANPSHSSYVWGMQLEHGSEEATWYCHTDGSMVDERLLVEFLDLQTEYVPLPGTVKHNLILTYKVIGDWL